MTGLVGVVVQDHLGLPQVYVEADSPAKVIDVRKHFLQFLWRLCNQEDVVGEDQVGKVLTVYVDSFLIPLRLWCY